MNFPIPFAKLNGTGNDFIVIDHRQPAIAVADQPGFARAVCRRNFSVGADGLILIENSDEADFSWRFYNADGSVAEMCGNGARCAARFAFLKGIAAAKMRFVTLAGIIRAEVTDGSVMIGLTPPASLRLDTGLQLAGDAVTVDSVNTGVPHVVLFTGDNGEARVREWGRQIRFHDEFQPAGTNVNFVQVTGPDALHVRTYERGVEDETMACGTGATAAAVIAALRGRVRPPVKVTTSGGMQLVIHFRVEEDGVARDLALEGPAHFVYEGLLQPDALL
ncbi:MAG: diaminopimelate epimerase [Thermodesulfobacteriota bacterium]